MTIVTFVNLWLLVAAAGAVLVMIDHMNKDTRNAIRWSAVLLLVGTVAEGFGYLWHWAEWTDTLFFGGAAMFLISNVRGPTAHDSRSDLYAYGTGGLTVLGLLLAWVTS